MQQLEDFVNKNQRCISFLKIIWGIISLIFAALSYVNWSTFTGDYQNIVDTWKALPIVDVQISVNCPSDYVAIAAYESFPGTTYACDCRPLVCGTTDNTLAVCSNTALTKAKCDPSSTQTTCRNFNFQLPPQELNLWRGLKVCVKRTDDSNLNALNRVHVFGNQPCPLGWVSCRNTTLFNPSSTEETVCTLPGQQCPVTSVTQFLTNQINPGTPCIEKRTFIHSRTGSSYTMCLARAGARPAVNFGFFRDFPCSSYSSAAWESNTRSVDDIRAGSSYYCSKADTRWAAIDSMREADFYSDNLIPNIYVKNMTSSLLTPINHMSQPEIVWYPTCPADRKQFTDAGRQIKTIFQCAIGVLILSSFAGVADIYLSYQIARGRKEEEVMHDGGWKIHMMNLVLCLAKLIPLAVALNDSRTVESLFRSLRDTVCTDPFSNETVQFLAKEIYNTSWQNVLIIIATLFTIILTAKDLYTIRGCKCFGNSSSSVDNHNADSTESTKAEQGAESTASLQPMPVGQPIPIVEPVPIDQVANPFQDAPPTISSVQVAPLPNTTQHTFAPPSASPAPTFQFSPPSASNH